jgi:hypothetical protein
MLHLAANSTVDPLWEVEMDAQITIQLLGQLASPCGLTLELITDPIVVCSASILVVRVRCYLQG